MAVLLLNVHNTVQHACKWKKIILFGENVCKFVWESLIFTEENCWKFRYAGFGWGRVNFLYSS